jgi:hypothetical protein
VLDDVITPIHSKSRARRRPKLYREFLGCADALGKRRGWAWFLYRANTGEAPLSAWRKLAPLPPSDEAIAFARKQLARFIETLRSA